MNQTNRIQKLSRRFIAVATVLLASSSAFADARVSLLGGIDYNLDSASVTRFGRTATVEGGLGFAGGALIGIDMVEIGAMYLARKYVTSVTGRSDTTSNPAFLHVPGVVRLGKGMVTFAAGGFYEFGLSNGAGSNYGIVGGPRLGDTLFLDLRFAYGLQGSNTKDILALVGYSFGKSR
jgi:hypothetical protein